MRDKKAAPVKASPQLEPALSQLLVRTPPTSDVSSSRGKPEWELCWPQEELEFHESGASPPSWKTRQHKRAFI